MLPEKYENTLGHIGYTIGIIGTILLGQQIATGWLCSLSAEAIWVYLGFKWKKSSIWFWCFIYAIAQVYGYMTWIN